MTRNHTTHAAQNRRQIDALDDTQGEIRKRLQTVSTLAKTNATALSILAAQALGIPTDQLLTLLLSIL